MTLQITEILLSDFSHKNNWKDIFWRQEAEADIAGSRLTHRQNDNHEIEPKSLLITFWSVFLAEC